MIILLPMMLAVQDAPAAEAPAEDEIVVLGQRLKDWRGKFNSRKGVVTCKTTKSTGDRAIDKIGCDAMTRCIGPIAPQLDAIAEQVKDKAERQKQLNALIQAQMGCLTETRKAAIEALAAERRRS